MILYALLGAAFGLALGLLIGAVFDSASGGAGVEGSVIILIGGIFVGPLGHRLSSRPASRVARMLATCSLDDVICNAAQASSTLNTSVLGIGASVGSTTAPLIASAWKPRSQSAEVGVF